MNANIEKRLEALEQESLFTREPITIVRAIVNLDRQIISAMRRGERGTLVAVSADELEKIRRTDDP